MEENAIQINDRIILNVDISLKHVVYVKKIKLKILLQVVVKRKIFNKYYG